MSHELYASITAKLSDGAREQAAEVQKITSAWASFLDTLPSELSVRPALTIGRNAPDPIRLALRAGGTSDGPVKRRGRPRKAPAAA